MLLVHLRCLRSVGCRISEVIKIGKYGFNRGGGGKNMCNIHTRPTGFIWLWGLGWLLLLLKRFGLMSSDSL